MWSLQAELVAAVFLIQTVGTSCTADMAEVDHVAAAIQHAQYIDLDTTPTGGEGELRYGEHDEFVARYHFSAWIFRMGFQASCPVPCMASSSEWEWLEEYARNLTLYDVDLQIENSGEWSLLIEATVSGVCAHHLYVSSGGQNTSIERQPEEQFRTVELEPGESYTERFTCGDESTSFDDGELHVKQIAATPLPED